MSDSNIHLGKNGAASFVGPDAVSLYKALTLKSMIGLHRKCGMIPTRGVTITKMFKLAKEYTGKNYKRGEHLQAEADIQIWIETMKSALPITREG